MIPDLSQEAGRLKGRGMGLLGRLGYELKHALRGLRRDGGFTLVVLLSLAVGIGANAAVFSLVDQLLLRALPVKAPGQLVQLDWQGSLVGPGWGGHRLLPHPLYRQLAAQPTFQEQVFQGTFARHPTRLFLGAGATPQQVNAEIVTGSYFSVLGVGAALGRVLDDTDDQRPGAHPVVVVSHDYWKGALGARADVVGMKVTVNRHSMTVVGVAAAGFRGVDRAESSALWIPTMMKKEATPEFDWLDDRRGRWLHVFGRLRPGVSAAQARAALQPWFRATLEADSRREDWPSVSDQKRRAVLASTLDVLPAARGDSPRSEDMQTPLLVLFGITGLVLVLACLNVANLALARGFARRREMAVRAALGASRSQILRQMAAQALLLAAGGGLLGLLLAPFVSQGLLAFLPANADLRAAVDWRVLAFGFLATSTSGVVFGLAPALQASRAQPSHALKEHSAAVAGGVRLRKALVVGQIALALILLIGAGLFGRTLAGLRLQGPGYSTANLLTFELDAAKNGYGKAESTRLARQLLASLEQIPEVEAAGLSTARMLDGAGWSGRVTLARGRVVAGGVHFSAVSPGLFRTLGAPLIAGRPFDQRDQRDASAPGPDFRVAIINEQMARAHFGDRNPIGERIGQGGNLDTPTDIEIVGVVKTFHYRGVREVERQVYFPAWESTVRIGQYFVRTRGPAPAAFAAIREAIRRLDPGLPAPKLRTLDEQIDQVLLTERMLATLAAAFAGLALALSVIGLYGVMSFVVTRRTREIGIRMALGALPRSAVAGVLRETGWLVLVGLALALPAVWALGRLVESQLHGVRPTDLLTLAGAAGLVALVALLASALPARRASAVNPTDALRAD
jgi:predicted permease